MNNLKLSFEFFPPKSEAGRARIQSTRDELAVLQPDFYSVTYGAGGSTREFTYDTEIDIQKSGHQAAPHLSFGGDGEEQVVELLDKYVEQGINRVVALRGDIPSGIGATRLVYASELVELLREKYGDHFTIAVACYPEIHPEAPGYDSDIDYLRRKMDAGADLAISQYFFNAEAFSYFMERCQSAGIDKPIYPGIMPITNSVNLLRFSDNCGADIPRWIRKRLEDYQDDEASLLSFGEEVVSSLCDQLIAMGVPGFHFYTMNRSAPTLNICRNLGLIE